EVTADDLAGVGEHRAHLIAAPAGEHDDRDGDQGDRDRRHSGEAADHTRVAHPRDLTNRFPQRARTAAATHRISNVASAPFACQLGTADAETPVELGYSRANRYRPRTGPGGGIGQTRSP